MRQRTLHFVALALATGLGVAYLTPFAKATLASAVTVAIYATIAWGDLSLNLLLIPVIAIIFFLGVAGFGESEERRRSRSEQGRNRRGGRAAGRVLDNRPGRMVVDAGRVSAVPHFRRVENRWEFDASKRYPMVGASCWTTSQQGCSPRR